MVPTFEQARVPRTRDKHVEWIGALGMILNLQERLCNSLRRLGAIQARFEALARFGYYVS
jgi:hypothetical protein